MRHLSASLIQISPYPPESGSDYHKMLAKELSKRLKFVLVLAGLNYPLNYAERTYGSIEKYDNITVIRAYWAPRLIECRRPLKVIKYAVISIRNLIFSIKKLQKHTLRTIAHFHYGPTTWPGALLGEHYVFGMIFARLLTNAKVVWTIHTFLLPYQVYQRVYDITKSKMLAFLAMLYYIFLAKLAALACHRIIVLTISNDAPITKYFSLIFGKRKVTEMVHPLFRTKYKYKLKPKKEKRINILALGYIRVEKNYETLFHALYKLKQTDLDAYGRIRVIVAGTIERWKREDMEYLAKLQHLHQELRLDNVEFKIKHLTPRKWHEMLRKADMVWCAYKQQYGPSGIYAWALTYNKVPIIMRSYTWEGLHIQGVALDKDKAVDELIKLFRSPNMIDKVINVGGQTPLLTEHVQSLIQNYIKLEPCLYSTSMLDKL